MSETLFFGTLFFVLGAVIGSFLNVCIVRWPEEKSVVKPRSHCPNCKKMIAWYDNIPFLSYILLGGKCRHCKIKFSFRYFLVELITALTFLAFYFYFGLNILLLPYLIMVCGFIVATFVDLKHRIIPDEVSVGGMFVGLALSLLIPQMHGIDPSVGNFWINHLQSLGLSALGVLIGGGSIYLMGMLGDFLFKKESMGGGDVKLMAMVGAFLGWIPAILAFFIAPFFGMLYGIIGWLRTRDSTMAYGPFLVLGSLIAMFWGNVIVRWFAAQYGY